MSTSLYRSAVTIPQHALESLTGLITKAKATSSLTPASKLIDDMLPLSFQVKMLCDLAHKSVARTTFTEPTPVNEALNTWEDLEARVEEAKKILAGADAAKVNESAEKEVVIGMGPGKSGKATAADYVFGYVVPNVYFHLTAFYAVLRKEGVEVGKMDFLGSFVGPYVTVVEN